MIDSWAQGNVYSGSNPVGISTQGTIASPNKAQVLLDCEGKIFGKSHPQYEDYSVDQFASARSCGAKGDGRTDDTAALQKLLNEVFHFALIIMVFVAHHRFR